MYFFSDECGALTLSTVKNMTEEWMYQGGIRIIIKYAIVYVWDQTKYTECKIQNINKNKKKNYCYKNFNSKIEELTQGTFIQDFGSKTNAKMRKRKQYKNKHQLT